MCQVLSCRGAQTFTFHSLSASVPKHISCIHVKTTGVNSIYFFLSIPRRFVGGFWTFWLREKIVWTRHGHRENRAQKKASQKTTQTEYKVGDFQFREWVRTVEKFDLKSTVGRQKSWAYLLPSFCCIHKNAKDFWFSKTFQDIMTGS